MSGLWEQPFLVELMNQGLLALPAGPNVIRLLPPLTITHEELDTAADTISRVLK